MQPLAIALIAGFSSILGGTLVAVINYMLSERSKNRDREINERYKQIERDQSERSRRHDLYKVIYPEQVKAAKDLMQSADNLYQLTSGHATFGDPNNQERKTEILDLSTQVHILCTTSEWLLGNEVKRRGIELVRMSRMLFNALTKTRMSRTGCHLRQKLAGLVNTKTCIHSLVKQ
jgi:hypothetical protein